MARSREAKNAASREWRRKNPDKVRAWNKRYRGTARWDLHNAKQRLRVYGISLEEYAAMLAAQKTQCAICGDEASGVQKYLAVDHHHVTARVRALLCRQCNAGLGQFRERPDLLRAAALYLEHHAAVVADTVQLAMQELAPDPSAAGINDRRRDDEGANVRE